MSCAAISTAETFTVAQIADGQEPMRCDYFAGCPEQCQRRATFAYRDLPYCLEHAAHLIERDMAGRLLEVHRELEQLRAMAKHRN
jgi:hypothetical protein